jgi:hypothetical protein
MSTTKNGFCTRLFARVQSSIVATMKINSSSRFCILFVFAAIINAGSANAKILTTLSGSQAQVTNNVFEAFNTEVQCGDGSIEVFNYRQRMVINGKVEMVLTEFIWDVGTYDLFLIGQCDGKNLYAMGNCQCIRTDFKFKNTLCTKDKETVATVNIETAPQEVSFTGRQIQSMVAPGSAGFLWIRKDDNRIHQSYKNYKNV